MWWRNKKQAEGLDLEKSVAPKGAPRMAAGQKRFLAPEVLASIQSLELLARSVVEGFISGLHRSPYTGFSTEFAEYRQYMPGDDLRYLDWKLLGRTDRYYIKKFRADTNAQCHILLDASASMKYTTSSITKLQYAQFLGASLAYLANKQQDAVGLIAFDQQVRTHVPALSRTGHMRTIFGRMEQLEAGNETNLSKMLHEAAERIYRRGIIVVISDFYDEPEEVIKALQHLKFKGNDVIVFQVLDRNEIDFNFTEPVLLEDSETEEQIHVMPDILADGYRQAMSAHIEELREGMAKNKIDYELLTTDRALDYALYSFLSKRANQ
ncbi:MAG: DUF58 domain-containing protein [Acidobacteria bacterium]|nr:DUF58 domain-containing protein [Acidobacteriota bacterium]